jgi:hypothetical protein
VADVNAHPAARGRPATTRSRRNTFGRNLVNPGNYDGNYDTADTVREFALTGTAAATRVGSSWGVQTSDDDVDFPRREALQRFRQFAGSATLGEVKDAFR